MAPHAPPDDVPVITDELVDDILGPYLLDAGHSLVHAGRSWCQAFADMRRAIDQLEQRYQATAEAAPADADTSPI